MFRRVVWQAFAFFGVPMRWPWEIFGPLQSIRARLSAAPALYMALPDHHLPRPHHYDFTASCLDSQSWTCHNYCRSLTGAESNMTCLLRLSKLEDLTVFISNNDMAPFTPR